jgi:16S rRNA (guanine966-N2)-methyltransferase
MFMVLEPLVGLRVLDLFAGSGALGIEALSRGAERVDFVEPDRNARRALETNVETLGLSSRATIWPIHLPRDLKLVGGRVREADLILLDPPYGGEIATLTLAALGGAELRAEARVVVEHHSRDALPESCGRLVKARERRYGETRVTTYRVVPERISG